MELYAQPKKKKKEPKPKKQAKKKKCSMHEGIEALIWQ